MAAIDKDGDKFQFDLVTESFISSRKPLAPLKASKNGNSVPDISPLDQSISIPVVDNYKRKSVYRK